MPGGVALICNPYATKRIVGAPDHVLTAHHIVIKVPEMGSGLRLMILILTMSVE